MIAWKLKMHLGKASKHQHLLASLLDRIVLMSEYPLYNGHWHLVIAFTNSLNKQKSNNTDPLKVCFGTGWLESCWGCTNKRTWQWHKMFWHRGLCHKILLLENAPSMAPSILGLFRFCTELILSWKLVNLKILKLLSKKIFQFNSKN